MKYLYWLGVLAVVVGGIYLANTIKIQPETVSKIRFTQFDSPEDLGRAVFEQLRSEIRMSPVVFLGVTPNKIEDMEIWRGFFAANQEAGEKYDTIIVEPLLPYVELFRSGVRFDMKNDMPRFVEGVRKAREQGLRVAVIVPNIYSSQLLQKNPAFRLRHEFNMQFLSLSATNFPLTREQEVVFEPKCTIEVGRDLGGTGPLGCAIQKLARRTYRMKLPPKKFSGLLEQITPQDYLILGGYAVPF